MDLSDDAAHGGDHAWGRRRNMRDDFCAFILTHGANGQSSDLPDVASCWLYRENFYRC